MLARLRVIGPEHLIEQSFVFSRAPALRAAHQEIGGRLLSAAREAKREGANQKQVFSFFSFLLSLGLTTIGRLPFSQSDADAAVSIAKM